MKTKICKTVGIKNISTDRYVFFFSNNSSLLTEQENTQARNKCKQTITATASLTTHFSSLTKSDTWKEASNTTCA